MGSEELSHLTGAVYLVIIFFENARQGLAKVSQTFSPPTVSALAPLGVSSSPLLCSIPFLFAPHLVFWIWKRRGLEVIEQSSPTFGGSSLFRLTLELFY